MPSIYPITRVYIIFRLISLYENHVLYHKGKRGTHRTQLQNALSNDYNDTSFQNFSSLVIDMAKQKRHGYGECSVNSIGGHVMPYYHCCAHCDVNYDVIGLTEEFATDFEFITYKANLSNIHGQSSVMHNVGDGRRNKTKKKSQVLEEEIFALPSNTSLWQDERIGIYLSMLTKDAVRQLYDVYKVDFEMFGYDASKYLK